MTIEEAKQYAIQAVTRGALRDNLTSKLGRFEYSIGKYSKLVSAVIAIEKGEEETFLLLISIIVPPFQYYIKFLDKFPLENSGIFKHVVH